MTNDPTVMYKQYINELDSLTPKQVHIVIASLNCLLSLKALLPLTCLLASLTCLLSLSKLSSLLLTILLYVEGGLAAIRW